MVRDDCTLHAAFEHEIDRVKRTRASEAKKCEVARIMASFCKHRPQLTKHVGVDDPDDCSGRFFDTESKFLADTLDGQAGRLGVQIKRPTQEIIRIDAT